MGRTEESEAALEYALEEYPDATITVIHVTATSDPLDLFGSRDPETYMVPACDDERDEWATDPNAFSRGQRKRAERVFDRACELSDAYGREIEPVVRSGNPVTEIVTYADSHAVDGIVIADHHRTELRPLLRNVSESIARQTDTPVTIVC